jgi:hypothetical protein
MRPRTALALLLAPLSLAVITACGEDEPAAAPSSTVPAEETLPPVPPTTETPTTEAPAGYVVATGSDDVVISVRFEGGFMMQGGAFAQLPNLLVTGDGRALVPGVTTLEYPGPLRMPVMQRTVTPEGVQALLAQADELGLLAEVEYANDMTVADAPDTVVTITVDGVTYEHRAYALDATGTETDEARQALSEFVAAATNLEATVGADELGDEEPFAPEHVLFQAYPQDEEQLAGLEVLPTVVEWPADASAALADAAECASLPADEAAALFDEANQETLFRQDDVVYRLAVIDQLPGRSC